jgi:competence CoiA-like predicted nuclease
MDYNQLVSVANDQKNAIINEIYSSGLSDQEKELEAAKVAEYYGQFQQDLRGDPDLDIIKILETTQTFAFARYLQGSNRLLKDVIAQANSIVRLGGFTNSHEKTMNRYKQFLDYFAREYNEELQYVLDPKDYEAYKIRIAPNGLSFTGGWNPLKTDTGTPGSSAQTSNYFNSQKIDNLDGLVDDDLLNQLRSAD